MTEDLGRQQAALVAALTAGAPLPAGFDPRRVGAARDALLRKRAGEAARHWPLLAAGLGESWVRRFTGWAAARPVRDALRDGWDLARELAAGGELVGPAAAELAAREAGWRYDGRSAPRTRRWPAIARAGGAVAVQLAGRVRVLREPPAGR